MDSVLRTSRRYAATILVVSLFATCCFFPFHARRRAVSDYVSELTGTQVTRCGGYVVGIQGWEETQNRVLGVRWDYQCGRRLAGRPPTFDSDHRRRIAQCHSQRDGGFSQRRSRELLVIAGDCGSVAPKIDVVGYSYVSPKFIGNDPILILPV